MLHDISPVYRIKCLFAGEASVGKSSIVHLIKNGFHNPVTEPTIGMEFCVQTIELEEYPYSVVNLPRYYFQEVDNSKHLQTVKVQLWDASGSARFKSIVQSYMRDLDIVFMVFNLSDRSSFEALSEWKKEIEKYRKIDSIPLYVIVGAKCDLRSRQISEEEIQKLCKEWNSNRYIISAVQGNSSSMINRMLYKSVENYHQHILHLGDIGEKIPEHVTATYCSKTTKIIDLDVEPNSNFCCVIS